jgi:hypothetical protein
MCLKLGVSQYERLKIYENRVLRRIWESEREREKERERERGSGRKMGKNCIRGVQ